jgi:hypothetical protein
MMNYKGFGRMIVAILRRYPGIRLERLRKATKYLSQNNRPLDRHLNAGPHEYEL